jgi:hypothetical protein
MHFKQMLWAPRRVPVCVFERIPRNSLISHRRLIFLGRMAVSPILFLGAAGYFAYLADRDRFRSVVLSELWRIMSFADLDNTYRVEDWFVKRNQLLIHVAKNGEGNRVRFNLPVRRSLSWLRRKIFELR